MISCDKRKKLFSKGFEKLKRCKDKKLKRCKDEKLKRQK